MLHRLRAQPSVAALLILGWTNAASAAPIALHCDSLQGSIIFSEPFQSTSGNCSTGSFTGSLDNPLEGIITARVTRSGNTLTHQHDVQDIGSGTNWLVSTEATFHFTVTQEVESISLQASSSPTFEETFLQLQGPSGTFSFLGGGWQSPGSPPSGSVPIGGTTLELLPGTYSGFYRFKTFTSSGHKVESVWIAIDATLVPEPSTGLLFALGLACMGCGGRTEDTLNPAAHGR